MADDGRSHVFAVEWPDGHVGLADSVRRLITAVCLTDGSPDLTARAARLVDEATAALGPVPDVDSHRTRTESGGRVMANPFDSPVNPIAPPLRPIPCGAGEYVAEMTLSPAYEGPAGRVHGGVVTGILDHCSGLAGASLGVIAMSVSITVDLRRATPYGQPLTVTARVSERAGRKIWVDAAISTESGEITASSRTLLIELADTPAWHPAR